MGNKLSSKKSVETISNPLLTLVEDDMNSWQKRVIRDIYRQLSDYTLNNIKDLNNKQQCYLAKTLILNCIYDNLNILIKEYNHNQRIYSTNKNKLGLVELLQLDTEGTLKDKLDQYYDSTVDYYNDNSIDAKEKIKMEVWFHNETVKLLNWLIANYQIN